MNFIILIMCSSSYCNNMYQNPFIWCKDNLFFCIALIVKKNTFAVRKTTLPWNVLFVPEIVR